MQHLLWRTERVEPLNNFQVVKCKQQDNITTLYFNEKPAKILYWGILNEAQKHSLIFWGILKLSIHKATQMIYRSTGLDYPNFV